MTLASWSTLRWELETEYHRPGDLETICQIVMNINPAYKEAPSRCFVRDGRVFPNLRYSY